MDGSGLAVFYEVFVFRADARFLLTRAVGLDLIKINHSLDADIRQKHRTDFLFGLLHRHEERLPHRWFAAVSVYRHIAVSSFARWRVRRVVVGCWRRKGSMCW